MTGVGHLAVDLPSWVDLSFVRNVTAVLAIAGLVILVVIAFMVRSVAARLVAVVLIGASVFGVLHYRNTLDHCDKSGCACKLFGDELDGGGCATATR